MREREPTEEEQVFFRLLEAQAPGVQDWYHEDRDGTPWMTVSYDYVSGGAIRATLRVDYDGGRLAGGWSPAYLNWDDGVRANDAQIDTREPDGIDVAITSPVEAAALAAEWFRTHPGPDDR